MKPYLCIKIQPEGDKNILQIIKSVVGDETKDYLIQKLKD